MNRVPAYSFKRKNRTHYLAASCFSYLSGNNPAFVFSRPTLCEHSVGLLDHPEKRKKEKTQMVRPLNGEADPFTHRTELRQLISPVVHQHFIIDVVAGRAGRDFHVCDTASPQYSMHLPQSFFVVVDMLEHIEYGYPVNTLVV
jgi:hypothetical protein